MKILLFKTMCQIIISAQVTFTHHLHHVRYLMILSCSLAIFISLPEHTEQHPDNIPKIQGFGDLSNYKPLSVKSTCGNYNNVFIEEMQFLKFIHEIKG